MKSATVHINELRVQVPGLMPEQARRLGELVAQRLSESSFSMDRSRHISSTKVHVRSNGENSLEQMADDIIAGIRRSLA